MRRTRRDMTGAYTSLRYCEEKGKGSSWVNWVGEVWISSSIWASALLRRWVGQTILRCACRPSGIAIFMPSSCKIRRRTRKRREGLLCLIVKSQNSTYLPFFLCAVVFCSKVYLDGKLFGKAALPWFANCHVFVQIRRRSSQWRRLVSI